MTTVSATSSNTGTSSTGTTTPATSVSDTYQTFLKLLTSQIQNQDPLSPMDTTQWTNQLVQYNSVEQQLKTNSLLSTLITQGQSGGLSSGVSYIGKTVSASSSTSTLSGGKADWTYTLGKDANQVKLTVLDKTGAAVYSTALGPTKGGDNSFSWDGSETQGGKLASGDYTLMVDATDASGTGVASTLSRTGQVSAVFEDNSVVMLKLGSASVPLSAVTSVQ